jgi:phospholipid/cholesterol/gamma-HCH transport system substrate-binding protein
VTAEVKVGIVVVLAAVMLAVSAYYLSPQWGWLHGGEEVIAYFEDSQGITPGTYVRLAGVPIGRVEAVGLGEHPDFRGAGAKVTIRIETEDAMLLEGDRLRIDAGSLLGEKFVNVIRRPSRPRQPLDYSKPIPTEPSIGVGQLVSESAELVRTVNDVAARIGDVVGDPEVMVDMRDAVGDLQGLTASLRAQIAEGRIERILDDLAVASADLRTKLAAADVEGVIEKMDEAADEGRELLAAISAQDIQDAVVNMRAMTENVRLASDGLRLAVIESGLLQDAQTTMATLRRVSGELEATATLLREQLSDEQRIQRVDAILTNAEELSKRALTISEDLAQAASSGKEAAADAQQIATMWKGRLTKPVKPLGKIVVDPRVELTVGARTGEVQLDTDLFFGKRGSPSQVIFGLRDLGDASDVNLQYARRVSPDLRVRGGLIAGDVGAAVDMHLMGPWGATAEAYERSDDWRIDMTGAYDFGTGLNAIFGFDDLLGGVDPFVGSRYEW